MTEWEARYKSVVALVEPKHVEAAEKIVKAAHGMACSTRMSLGEALYALLTTANRMKLAEVKIKMPSPNVVGGGPLDGQYREPGIKDGIVVYVRGEEVKGVHRWNRYQWIEERLQWVRIPWIDEQTPQSIEPVVEDERNS